MPRTTSTRGTNRPTTAVPRAESNKKSAQGHGQLSDTSSPHVGVQSSIDSVVLTALMPGAASISRESKGIGGSASDPKDTQDIAKKKKHTESYDPASHASKSVGLEGVNIGSQKDKDGRRQDKSGPRKDKNIGPWKDTEGSRKSNSLRGEDKDGSRKPSSRREKGKGGSQKDNVDSKEETIKLPNRSLWTPLPLVKSNRHSRQ